jgi:hypothetical protein
MVLSSAAARSEEFPPHRLLLRKLGVMQGPRRSAPKVLKIRETIPVIGGLRWRADAFTPMDTEETPAISEAVFVPNDLEQKPIQMDSPDLAGFAMIWGQIGKGRVVVVGDSEWIKNLDSRKESEPTKKNDNAEIFLRLARWAGALPKSSE